MLILVNHGERKTGKVGNVTTGVSNFLESGLEQ